MEKTRAEIPIKYADYPDNYLIGSETIAWIFGIGRHNIWDWMKRGAIPRPDSTELAWTGRPKNLWELGNIRKFIGEKNAIQK